MGGNKEGNEGEQNKKKYTFYKTKIMVRIRGTAHNADFHGGNQNWKSYHAMGSANVKYKNNFENFYDSYK